ncbi:MAG: hypothetical protein ACRD5K_12955 [Candidatus Acidiferrales bacterium]
MSVTMQATRGISGGRAIGCVAIRAVRYAFSGMAAVIAFAPRAAAQGCAL